MQQLNQSFQSNGLTKQSVLCLAFIPRPLYHPGQILGIPRSRDAGDGSQWLSPGGFLAFCLDFGPTGIAKAKLNLRAANVSPTLRIQMRLDDSSGLPLATFSARALSRRGQLVHARNTTGPHELYLVVTGGRADISNFSFTPIQPRHARHTTSSR